MDYFLNAALLAGATTPLVALGIWRARGSRWGPAVLFVLLLALDDLLTVLPNAIDALDLIGGRWNWDGKLMSLAGALLFVLVSPLTRREVGITLRQRPNSTVPALAATTGLTALSFGIGLVFGGGSIAPETLAFQLTMPGVVEELAYRGVLLALLHRAFPAEGDAISWWPLIITATAFGVWHGLSVSGGAVSFDFLSASFPFVGGLAYGWLRERTGSLLFPILAHNLGNTAALLGGLVG